MHIFLISHHEESMMVVLFHHDCGAAVWRRDFSKALQILASLESHNTLLQCGWISYLHQPNCKHEALRKEGAKHLHNP